VTVGGTDLPTTAPRSILVVCSANQCRSPLVAALLRSKLAARGLDPSVTSVGTRAHDGARATDGTIQAARRLGLDLAVHRSTALSAPAIADADLVIALERAHLRDVVAIAPSAWARTYTLKELVRRGRLVGPRPSREPLATWLARVGAGRQPRDLLGASPADDVDDPTGSYTTDHPSLADETDRLTDDLVFLLYGP
jgi:protein-tyrosine phosphatase